MKFRILTNNWCYFQPVIQPIVGEVAVKYKYTDNFGYNRFLYLFNCIKSTV